MKKYKIGDTIYVKDTVADIDTDDNDMTYRGSRCGWLYKSNVIDELPTSEPVKPVLPKRVANEMEAFRESNKLGAYLNLVLNNTSTATYQWANNDQDITDLVNAWNNGYTIKPETKLYNLVLGFDDYYKGLVTFYKAGSHGFTIGIDAETYDANLKHDDSYQFTQEEIDKYNEGSWLGGKIDLNKLKVEVKN